MLKTGGALTMMTSLEVLTSLAVMTSLAVLTSLAVAVFVYSGPGVPSLFCFVVVTWWEAQDPRSN